MTDEEFEKVESWLNRGWEIDNEINALIQAKDRAFSALVSPPASFGKERVDGGGENGVQKKEDHLVELGNEIDNRIDELCKIKCEILRVIKKINNSKLRTILIERYINFKGWSKIADIIHYSERHTMNLYNDALEKLKDFI